MGLGIYFTSITTSPIIPLTSQFRPTCESKSFVLKSACCNEYLLISSGTDHTFYSHESILSFDSFQVFVDPEIPENVEALTQLAPYLQPFTLVMVESDPDRGRCHSNPPCYNPFEDDMLVQSFSFS